MQSICLACDKYADCNTARETEDVISSCDRFGDVAATGKYVSAVPAQKVDAGKKFDTGKLRWDLIPIEYVEDVVKVLTFGAAKYGANNWQKVEDGLSRYYAALMRHIVAWKRGETDDPESNLPHLAHAMCNILFIQWIEEHK
jgi:hypothetical protein